MKVGDLISVLDPGIYEVRIKDLDPTGKTKAGDPMVSLQMEVVNNEDWEGAMVWDNLPVNAKAAWKWIQVWVALGGSTEDEIEGLQDLADRCCVELPDKTIYIKVKKDTYEGKTRPKVEEYLAPGVGKSLMGAQERAKNGVPF